MTLFNVPCDKCIKKETLGLYIFFTLYFLYWDSRGHNGDPGIIINVCLGGCLGVFPCPLYTWLCYYIRVAQALLHIFGLAGSQSTVSISRTRTRTMRTVSCGDDSVPTPLEDSVVRLASPLPPYLPLLMFCLYSSFFFFSSVFYLWISVGMYREL